MRTLTTVILNAAAEMKSEDTTGEHGEPVLIQPRFFGVRQMVTAGEQSHWLLPLRDRAVIVGAKCPKCGLVYAPAYLQYCANPACRMAELELVDLPDNGVMASSPIVTLFAPARMDGAAPFAHGQVYLGDAGNAMMFAILTSKNGMIRRGIYAPNEPVKLVFLDDRVGCITDVFCLPLVELTEAQLRKTPLFASDVQFSNTPPADLILDPKHTARFPETMKMIGLFLERANQSKRNQERLVKVNFRLNVFTGGGNFDIVARDGVATISQTMAATETTGWLQIQDPTIFEQWTNGGAISNGFALGDLALSNVQCVRALEELDRLWRAAKREGVLA